MCSLPLGGAGDRFIVVKRLSPGGDIEAWALASRHCEGVGRTEMEAGNMKNWNVRKKLVAREDMPPEHRLKRTLSWPHLVALGVGAIVGTGILTLIGVGAAKAGPAVILSFAIAGLICACAALAYAEVATMIPASGSAYTYCYVVFGELIAWMIGVALILEYTFVVSAVAVGWSGYAAGFLKSIGLGLPDQLIQGPALGGIVNLPAIFIILVVAGLLTAGTRESATLNAVLVAIKIAALALFIAVALPVFNQAHFHPFMPLGFPRSGPPGSEVGVMAAAESSSSRSMGSMRSRPPRKRRRTRAAISRSASSAPCWSASQSTSRSLPPPWEQSLTPVLPTARSRLPSFSARSAARGRRASLALQPSSHSRL